MENTAKLRALPNIILSVALACPPAGFAMELLPKSEGQAAWEKLQGSVLGALGGACAAVKQPGERITAISAPGTPRAGLAVNKVIAAGLHPVERIKFVIGPEKKRGKPQEGGGLLAFDAPSAGTYVLGTVSQAWIGVVDQEREGFVKAKHYEWVDFCGRRMKAGVFELRAGARYWIQVSASPDPALDLFVAGPLD